MLTVVRTYYLYCAGFSFSFALLTTMFSIYHIEIVGMNPFQLVLTGAVLEASCFIFEVPTGIVADCYSRKGSIVIGLIIMGAGIIIEGALPLFAVIIIAQVIWGFGATFLSGADIAWLSDEYGSTELDKVLLKAAQIRQVATLCGIFTSIALAHLNISIPIITSGLLLMILGFALIFLMKEKSFKPGKQSISDNYREMFCTFKKGRDAIRKSQYLWYLTIAALIGGFYSEGFDRLWTFKILDEMNRDNRGYLLWFALISSGAVILTLIAIELVKRNFINKGVNPLNPLIVINIVLSAGTALFAFTGNFILAMFMFWLIQSMRRSSEPLADALLNKNIEDSSIRATVISMRGQLDQTGQIIGGPIAGLIALYISTDYGILFSAVVIIPIPIIYLHLKKQTNQLT